MSLEITCPKCDHEWNERPSKAGKSVVCPECGENVRVPRAGRSGESGRHRPAVPKDANVGRTLLIGGSIFLIGVLAMVGIRMAGMTPDVAEPSPPNAGTPQVPSPDALPSDGHSPTDGTIVVPDTVTPAIDESSAIPPTTTAGNYDDPAMKNATNTDRGRELMAAMDNVGLRVTGFTSDLRGSVAEAVETAVSGAIEQCKLSVRPPNTEPVMLVELQLRNEKLVLTAKLIARDQSELVRVWERSGTVTALSSQALTNGIMPPNLRRDVIAFFNSLRSEFNAARRQFAS